jgi:phosphate transport system substrate-binding protein
MKARNVWARLAVAASLLTWACAPQAASAQNLEGAGSTFVGPIFLKLFAKYKQETGTSVNYQVIGSGAGINAIKTRTVDFGASDAPLSNSEEGDMPAPIVQFPVVGGCIVMTYNLPGIGSGLRFTSEIIAGIYLGKIRNWNDPKIKAVNPSINLPALAIQPVHRTDGSGTTYIFTNYLKKANGEWAAGPGAGKSVNWPVGLGGKGNAGVAAVVSRTPGSIGYNELAYAIASKQAYGSVRNRAGNFVNATVETTTSAINQYVGQLKKDMRTPVVDAPGINSYPISGLVYVIIYKNPGPKAVALTKLFAWWLQPSQQEEVKTLYYSPLPPSLVSLNMKTLKSVHGSVVTSLR